MKGYIGVPDGIIEVDELPDEMKLGAKQRLFSMPGADFAKAIHSVNFAAGRKDPRAYISAVCVEIFPNELKAIATDGRRLAVNTTPMEGIDDPTYWILNTEEVEVYTKIIKKWRTCVAWNVSDHGTLHVSDEYGTRWHQKPSLFLTDGYAKKNEYIAFSHIDAEYPIWRNILPVGMKHNIHVNTYEIYETVEAMFTNTNTRHLDPEKKILLLEITDNRIAISPSRPLLLDAEDNSLTEINNRPALGRLANGDINYVKAERPFSHFRFAVAINANFLLDALRSIDDEYCAMGVNDSLSALCITPATDVMGDELLEHAQFVHFLMPCKDSEVETFNDSRFDPEDENLELESESD